MKLTKAQARVLRELAGGYLARYEPSSRRYGKVRFGWRQSGRWVTNTVDALLRLGLMEAWEASAHITAAGREWLKEYDNEVN